MLVKKVLHWHGVTTFLATFILIYVDKQFVTLTAYATTFLTGSKNISANEAAIWDSKINQLAYEIPNSVK